MGSARAIFQDAGLSPVGWSDTILRGSIRELPELLAGTGEGTGARGSGEEGRLPISKVVPGVRPRRRLRRTEEECRTGAHLARSGGRRDRTDVRCLQRVGPELYARMGETGGALPAALDRRSNAGGEDRQFRRASEGHHDTDRLRGAHPGTLGSLQLPERGGA